MYTLVYIWLAIQPFSIADPIMAIRAELNNIKSVKQADKFIKQLDDESSVEAKGYLALLNFIKSREFKSPFKKMRYFNRAKRLLEQLIELHPSNVELRFLRYSIQVSSPAFLGYNKNVESDLEYIKNEIQFSPLSGRVKMWILQNLLELKTLNEIDRIRIELELKRLL